MTWDEFLDTKIIDATYTGQILTDIECPKCGRTIYLDSTRCLSSYPGKYRYWCSCGWESKAHAMWYGGNYNERNN